MAFEAPDRLIDVAPGYGFDSTPIYTTFVNGHDLRCNNTLTKAAAWRLMQGKFTAPYRKE